MENTKITEIMTHVQK